MNMNFILNYLHILLLYKLRQFFKETKNMSPFDFIKIVEVDSSGKACSIRRLGAIVIIPKNDSPDDYIVHKGRLMKKKNVKK